MMLFKNKNYPYGKYRIVPLHGKFFRRFKVGKGIGYWKHPSIPIGVFVKWTLRLAFVEIQRWLSEKEIKEA